MRTAIDAVRTQVEAAIEGAPTGRTREGFYQAALSRDSDTTLIDREVVLAFPTTLDEARVKAECRTHLVDALSALRGFPWAARASVPGDKIDGLAIDNDGRLLAIEVKPGTETSSLVMTPIQVAMYARLLRAWIDTNQERARDILEGMVDQRRTLGLGAAADRRMRLPINVRPVIAVGGNDKSPVAADRFATVRQALHDAGEPLQDLTIWNITDTGEVIDRQTDQLR